LADSNRRRSAASPTNASLLTSKLRMIETSSSGTDFSHSFLAARRCRQSERICRGAISSHHIFTGLRVIGLMARSVMNVAGSFSLPQISTRSRECVISRARRGLALRDVAAREDYRPAENKTAKIPPPPSRLDSTVSPRDSQR